MADQPDEVERPGLGLIARQTPQHDYHVVAGRKAAVPLGQNIDPHPRSTGLQSPPQATRKMPIAPSRFDVMIWNTDLDGDADRSCGLCQLGLQNLCSLPVGVAFKHLLAQLTGERAAFVIMAQIKVEQ